MLGVGVLQEKGEKTVGVGRVRVLRASVVDWGFYRDRRRTELVPALRVSYRALRG